MRPLRERSRRALLLIPAILLATSACRPARGQVAGGAGAQKPSTPSRPSVDPLDQALDRVDAARTRLSSADAATAAAMRELDAALEDVSRLEGDERADFDTHGGAEFTSPGGDRIAWRAGETAMRAAAEAQRHARMSIVRAQRYAEHSVAVAMRDRHASCECSDTYDDRGDDSDPDDPADPDDQDDSP